MAEVDTQIVIAEHRNYISEETSVDMQERINRLIRMVYTFKQSLSGK